jgi:hypothetical protein
MGSSGNVGVRMFSDLVSYELKVMLTWADPHPVDSSGNGLDCTRSSDDILVIC